jgi:hypothetical protein
VSYSWVDPHFVALYEAREDRRLTERLLARVRERPELELQHGVVSWTRSGWLEQELPVRPHLRLL